MDKFRILFSEEKSLEYFLKFSKEFRKIDGDCMLLTVSLDALVTLQIWKNNNLYTWRDD